MDELHHLKDGDIVLYRRDDSPCWQFRIRSRTETGKVRWHRFSAKTDDLDTAKDFALEKSSELQFMKKFNIPENGKTFDFYAKKARDEMQEDIDQGGGKVIYKHYIGVIDNYLIPIWGKEPITGITPSLVSDYIDKLKKELGKQPAQSTLRTHFAAMRRVFEKARLQEAQIPRLSTKGSKKPQMRPSFDANEINDVLMPYLKTYIEITGGKRKNREFRLLLYGMVNFALLGGLRPPHEISNLRWNQISIKKTLDGKLQYVSIAVKGKTGKRDAIANQKLTDVLNQLKDINPSLASKKIKNIISNNDSLIFAYSDGTQPNNWAGGFRKVLAACNLKDDVYGNTRSLYSLRHYYITKRIEAGFNVFKLAVQAGTSVSVIENFYNKALPDNYAKELANMVNYEIDISKALGKKSLDNEVDDTLERVFSF